MVIAVIRRRMLGAAESGHRQQHAHIFIYDPVHRERVRPGTELKLEFLSHIPDNAKFFIDVRRTGSTQRYPVSCGKTVRLPWKLQHGTCQLQVKAYIRGHKWISQWLEVMIDPEADPELYETGERIYCQAPWIQMNVGKANANPCCNFTRKFRNPYREDAEDYDPWNSETIQAVRAALVRGCTKYCHSGCGRLKLKSPPREWQSDLAQGESLRGENMQAARDAFLRGDTVVQHSPLRIKLTVNHFCNHACLFCSRDVRSKWKANDAIFAILKRHMGSISHLGMTGGEPLVFLDEVRGRLDELEDELRGVMFEITTNASLISRSIDFLTALDRLNLYVSLNAGTRETYRLVHRQDHFQKVIDGIRLLQERRRDKHLHIRLKMVMMQQNKNDIAAYVEIAKDLGVQLVKFTPAALYTKADMTAADQIRGGSPDWTMVEAQLKQARCDLQEAGIHCYYTVPGWKREDVSDDPLALGDD